jgi:hypothetical protein
MSEVEGDLYHIIRAQGIDCILNRRGRLDRGEKNGQDNMIPGVL